MKQVDQPTIVAEQLTKSFVLGHATVTALTDFDLSIDRGGLTALMGPSGSGKSSLLNLIGALDQPSSGRIIVNNRDLGQLDSDERAEFRNQNVGFIFQNFNLIPVLTALENVLLPAQLGTGNKTKADLQSRAHELLSRVGLAGQVKQSANRLSGGQMQRVAIARALMNKPAIILADELTANLDNLTAAKVMELLVELSATENVTVIIATHDHSVLKYCNRIVSLRDGKLIKDEWTHSA